MEPWDIALEVERYLRTSTLNKEDTIESLITAMYKELEEED